ncbi:MAG: hypothetical protein ACMXYB_04500, partial [Candidatus Woesearchaeota archaeon]
MKVSSDKASKKVKTSKKKSIVKDSSSNKVSNKNQIKKASIKNVKSLDNSKKNTSTKKIEKNAQIQSSQEEITQNDVLHMTSQMMSSMNEKLRSLEQVKKNLEEKLNEVDSKVSKTQTNSKKNSNNTYKNTSGNKNINSSKTISNTLTKNTQKEVEELLLLTTKNIKKIHSTTNSSQEFIKPYIDSLEEFEAKLRLLHQKLISKSNTSKEIKNLTKQITNVIKDYTNKTQKFLLTKVKNSSPLSIQKDSTNILEEISKSKKHLQHLINKKVDLKELNQIIEPIENRINSTIETLQVVEKHDEEQFNELQNQLINSKKEIESQIINLEKEEHKKVSKKEYKEDIKNLQEELTHTIETLNLVDSKEKNLQIAIAKLQKEELSLKSLIHTINERSSLQTTKEDVSKEISMIKNQITNAFKSIEQLNFLEHKEFKTLKNKLNLKFKFFENKFVELDSKYINLVSKNELNFIKKELTQNIKKIIEVLNKNEIKEKHLEEDFNSLKNLVNLMNSEKIDLVKLKSELSPINNLILNLKKQDSKKINYLKHNLNESVKIVEDKISKIEDEEKKKVSKSSYTKDMNKLH